MGMSATECERQFFVKFLELHSDKSVTFLKLVAISAYPIHIGPMTFSYDDRKDQILEKQRLVVFLPNSDHYEVYSWKMPSTACSNT